MKRQKYGEKRILSKEYKNRDDIISWEVLNTQNLQSFSVKFISTNSEYVQGLRLAVDYCDGELEIEGTRSRGFEIWENALPPDREVKIYIDEQCDRVSIYNIFIRENGQRGSLMYGSGMIAEQINENKVIYHCNDVEIVETFDKLVFEITF